MVKWLEQLYSNESPGFDFANQQSHFSVLRQYPEPLVTFVVCFIGVECELKP